MIILLKLWLILRLSSRSAACVWPHRRFSRQIYWQVCWDKKICHCEDCEERSDVAGRSNPELTLDCFGLAALALAMTEKKKLALAMTEERKLILAMTKRKRGEDRAEI